MTIENIAVTELELQILQQIWEQGDRATVNAIVENWPEVKRPGYTTVLKTLQKMEQKGIVGHCPDGKKYLYFPMISKEKITRKRLNSIIDRVFSGNNLSFAEYFVNSSGFSPAELEALKKLISAKEQEEEEK
jgi:BlaI family transcriptional regulator, penicillinase repressor